jgi:CheY-like chemotaxis protein
MEYAARKSLNPTLFSITPTRRSPLKTPKILIADDDRDHQIMMALMLRKEGYDVVSAFDAKHAIQVAVEQNPDILLLDIHMGEEDGYAVQERLQQIDEMADKPVIYITGDKSNWINCIIAGLGAHAVLRKPFSQHDLLKTLKSLLAAPPVEKPIAAAPMLEQELPAPRETLSLNTFAGDVAVPNF